MISRRNFLILTATTTVAVSTTSGCAAAPLAIADGLVGKVLTEFAIAIGSTLLSDTIEDWISSLSGDEYAEANQAKNNMLRGGFNLQATNVYDFSGTSFYALNQPQGADCCGCFLGGLHEDSPAGRTGLAGSRTARLELEN